MVHSEHVNRIQTYYCEQIITVIEFILQVNSLIKTEIYPDVLYTNEDTIIQKYEENLTINHWGIEPGDEGIASCTFSKTGT